MSILVTGGTGLVGERLLKRMAAAGVACRALVRGGKPLPAGITPVEGDLLDPVAPTQAYPASKVVAEQALRESGLTWSILRLGFVYGEGDGHIESIPKLAGTYKWHPAQALSVIHHRDVAAAVDLALTGALDGQVVNLTDEAPTTMWELAALIGAELEPSSEPLPNPWSGRADGTLARRLGLKPSVATIYQARREGLL